MGNLYNDVGQTEQAREHYEKAAQFFDQTGNRHNAGGVRFNVAYMYRNAVERESALTRRRDLLHRAQAYARAALRDYQHYQGRAADKEAKAQRLLDRIAQALTELSA